MGIHVSIGNQRQKDGSIRPAGQWWMPHYKVILTMLPVSAEGGLLEPQGQEFSVVNEFFSGVYLALTINEPAPQGGPQLSSPTFAINKSVCLHAPFHRIPIKRWFVVSRLAKLAILSGQCVPDDRPFHPLRANVHQQIVHRRI